MLNDLKAEMKSAFTIPAPAIGIDVDGTIDQAPEFFATLTQNWPGEIHIITMRSDPQDIADTLQHYGLKWTHIHPVYGVKSKAEIIARHKLVMYFDDMPEVLQTVEEPYNVCLIRNPGNFDFETKQYIMSDKTAYFI